MTKNKSILKFPKRLGSELLYSGTSHRLTSLGFLAKELIEVSIKDICNSNFLNVDEYGQLCRLTGLTKSQINTLRKINDGHEFGNNFHKKFEGSRRERVKQYLNSLKHFKYTVK